MKNENLIQKYFYFLESDLEYSPVPFNKPSNDRLSGASLQWSLKSNISASVR